MTDVGAQGIAVVLVVFLGVFGGVVVSSLDERLVAFLGSGKQLVGSGLLEISQLFLVFLVKQRVGHGEHAVVNGVIGVGVGGIVRCKLVFGVDGRVVDLLRVVVGKGFDGEELAEVLLVAACAVHGGKVAR